MADSKAVTAGGSQTSDAMTLQTDTIQAYIQLKADNGGTPASGDTIDFILVDTSGDPDGASTEEYADSTHGTPLASLDTNSVDPAISGLIMIPPCLKLKVVANSNAASNSITVSAQVWEVGADGLKTDLQVTWT